MSDRLEIVNLEILEGGWEAKKPVIILDAATAQKALEQGQLEAMVKQALASLVLSGKSVAFLEEA